MAKKQAPKPLFALKEDFKESLDHFCQCAMFLEQQVRSALELNAVTNPRVAALLQDRVDAMRDAMIRNEDTAP